MQKEFNPPSACGVYLMKNASEKVIYVGKAKDLKKRVGSYFRNKKLDDKTLKLVSEVSSIDYIITNNETEALILESNLIKKFKGRYNVDLKESYRYPFVKITSEKFPKIEVIRAPKKTIKKTKNVFGPFVDARARKRVIGFVEKNFKIRTCKKLPKKACLKFYLDQCSAPCIGNISQEDYIESIGKAKKFFLGKKKELVTELEKEMKAFSKNRDFEIAIQKRDAIFSLKNLPQKQVVERFFSKNQDFIAFKKTSSLFAILLFEFHKGTMQGKKTFFFKSKLIEKDILEDFLQNYYSQTTPPNEIVLSELPKNSSEIQKTLSSLVNYSVALTAPKSGEKKKILDLVEKNLVYSLNPKNDPLIALKNSLNLPAVPNLIECFDVSHLGGTGTTASMVSFLNGKPNKSQYRRFRIRSVKGIDDYASMEEVVGRRYFRVLEEKLPIPNLVLIDGGKGQISAAIKVLKQLRLRIPVVGLAKRNEEIFIPARKTPIVLNKKSPELRVLTQVRDEAHRFAIKYQKKLREKI